MKFCPCGSNQIYLDCCGLYITGSAAAPTPEALMRSRYTAYTLGNIDYIAHTMKSPALDQFDREDARKWARRVTWLRLEVIAAKDNTVEFIAYYMEKNNKKTLHEVSEFTFDNGEWFYVSGKH